MKTRKSAPELDPEQNYTLTRKRIGWTPRKKTPAKAYEKLGFCSGLEIHQQLLTEKKLFCRCPAGIYQEEDEYDAELIRHMRPTLSELGEYDGTALMEFKTKKIIVYRVANRTTCTYDVDDTPPFKVNPQALDIALEIALLLGTNIVGELHITRKQYLDGSIPTGFQRTAIVGIEGRLPLIGKTVRVIQLSLEEDSCREWSDIGHVRVYSTDRLGIPLVETVTYPDMKTPDEVAEAAHCIRFLTRSTGKVRTGPGAAREDVNVSIRGGTRVEIKGVPSIARIPELTHNEAFRQKSLLEIRSDLLARIPDPKSWKVSSLKLDPGSLESGDPRLAEAAAVKMHFLAINLPGFGGILSFFTGPGRMFGDEISDRLKVIACIEKPNMVHSEEWSNPSLRELFRTLASRLQAAPGDAQILLWGPAEDIANARDTVEERCRLAFAGVPNETRQARVDGTTGFERVLPGPDRMYPDTDSAPLAIPDDLIERIRSRLPAKIDERLSQMGGWRIPEDAIPFLLSRNLMPLLARIAADFGEEPRFVATLLAHRWKHLLGRFPDGRLVPAEKIHGLFALVHERKLSREILFALLPAHLQDPSLDAASLLEAIRYTPHTAKEILSPLPQLREAFRALNTSRDPEAEHRWLMKQLRPQALGNLPLPELARAVRQGGPHV